MSGPAISVIIPTFNRASVLQQCLEALEAQQCDPSAFEVIVCDDGSPDGTRGVIDGFAARDARFRGLHQENSGANAARNHAIRAARAPLLLIINDDTIATPRLLQEHLEAHREYRDERVAVVGRVTVSPTLPRSRLAPLHLDRAFAGLSGKREHDWRAFFTCNVSVAKALVERGGMFEERMRYHEDLELAERLSHHGLRVIYRPEALGYHEHYLTEREFLAIAEREARSLVTWSRLAPDRISILRELGFSPAMSPGRRLRHAAVSWFVNPATLPAWLLLARSCPDGLERIAVKIYDQVYQSMKRTALHRELRSEAAAQDATSLRRAKVVTTSVTVGTFAAAIGELHTMVEAKRGGYVSCANAYSVCLARSDQRYRDVLNGAAMVTADGMAVVWALRALGHSAERVHNDDLFLACCAARPRWRHFLVGGREGQPEEVAAEMRRRFPGIEVVGARATPMRPVPQKETLSILEQIRRSRADIVWVAQGTPWQDEWMRSAAGASGPPMVGVGSLFDILGGRTRPAPAWVKRAGLQWLFRLIQEPRRLAIRYLVYNPMFVAAFALQFLRETLGRRIGRGKEANSPGRKTGARSRGTEAVR